MWNFLFFQEQTSASTNFGGGEGRKKGEEQVGEAFLFFQTKTFSDFLRQQQRQVSKVLLGGLYDEESPLSKLHGSLRLDVMGEIIWKQMLLEKWQVFPDQ